MEKVTKNELVKKEIIDRPDHYFNSQEITLGARLKEIKLSEEIEKGIQTDHAKEFIRDKILGFFKIGEVVSEIINWSESVDKDLKEAKIEYLLAQYFAKNDQNEEALLQIMSFLTNPQGNTLLNKIIRILDDTPPDIELSNHLSNVLRYIVNSRFAELFEEHKYALSQIEKLTPQSLTILADKDSWPPIKLGSYTASGSKITSDWLSEFTQAYCQSKHINDQGIVTRVQHSINELISMRFIEAHLLKDKNTGCFLTQVGESLYPYINA